MHHISPDHISDDAPPLGFVPVEGRGSLPFLLVHGESLVASASWALSSAGVELIDLGTAYDEVRASGRMLVVHDPLCPLVPVSFVEQVVAECAATGAVVAGVQPVTDTVKELRGEHVGRTHPREELMSVVSPVALPPGVVAALDGLLGDDGVDLPAWVADLSRRFPVRFLEAPALARRVGSEDDLAVLEALSRAGSR